VTEVFEHFVRSEDATVRETVSADGSLLDTPEGRVMNPGHAIETAWFMLEIARRRDDRVLLGRALKVLDGSLARGWDAEYGGLFYFIDVAGLPSPYLEHDMKLWWPHCEALYATLLAHHLTGDEAYADHFQRVHDWTFAHFPDPEHGEWFGYLRRDGSVASTMKGGLWKGPFHIPRAVMLCHQLLERM
jgi:N-acylglucosamine 2-epimerase